jgi:hypothetical protein
VAAAAGVAAAGVAAGARTVMAEPMLAMPPMAAATDPLDVKQETATAQQRDQDNAWQELLYDALHANVPSSVFACSGKLKPPFLCPNIIVEGKRALIA